MMCIKLDWIRPDKLVCIRTTDTGTWYAESSIGDVDDISARLLGNVCHVISSLRGCDVERYRRARMRSADLQTQLSRARLLTYH